MIAQLGEGYFFLYLFEGKEEVELSDRVTRNGLDAR